MVESVVSEVKEVSVEEIVAFVKKSCTEVRGEKSVVSYKKIRAVIDALGIVRNNAKADNKELDKEFNKLEKTNKAQMAKAWLEQKKPARVSYTMADGTVMCGRLDGIKEKTAHIVLDEVPSGTKKADRFVAFDKIVVDTEWLAEIKKAQLEAEVKAVAEELNA